MPDYRSELYNWINTVDNSYSSRYTLEQFQSKMTDKAYAKQMFDWIVENDNSFKSRYDFNSFYSKVNSTSKKKEGTVSKPVQSSSATTQKAKGGLSVSSGQRADGIYRLPGADKALYKKENGQWYVDFKSQGNFIPLQKGDVASRVKRLESNTVIDKELSGKYMPQYDYNQQATPQGFNAPKIPTVKDETDTEVFTGLPGKEENKYRIYKGAWQRSVPTGKGQYSAYETISNKGAVDYLNKHFKKNVTLSRSALVDEMENGQLKYTDINSALIDKSEESVVEELTKKYGSKGFTFEQDGVGDFLVVKSKLPNTPSIRISLDNWSGDTDSAEAERLRQYMIENEWSEQRNKERLAIQMYEEGITGRPNLFDGFTQVGGDTGIQDPNLKTQETDRPSVVMNQVPDPIRDRMNRQIQAGGARAYAKEKTGVEIDDVVAKNLTRYAITDKKNINAKAEAARQIPQQYVNDKMSSLEMKVNRVKSLFEGLQQLKTEIKSGMYEGDQLDEKTAEFNSMQEDAKVAFDGIEEVSAEVENLVKMKAAAIASIKLQKEKTGTYIGSIARAYTDAVGDILYNGLTDSDSISREEAKDRVASLFTVTTSEYKTSDDRSFFNKVMQSVSEFVAIRGVTLTAGAIAGGLGLGAVLTPSLLSNLAWWQKSRNNSYDELRKSYPNLDENERAMLSNIIGAAVGALEKVGAETVMGSGFINKYVYKRLGAVLAGLPKNATAQQIRDAITVDLRKTITSQAGSLLTSSFTEGLTEATQTAAEAGIKETYDWIRNSDTFKTDWGEVGMDMLRDFAMGAVAGGVINTVTSLSDSVSDMRNAANYGVAKEVANDPELLSVMKDSLRLKVAKGEMSLDEAKGKLMALREFKVMTGKVPGDLSTEQSIKALELIEKRDAIQKEIEGKDPALVEAKKQEINQINEQLKNIGNAVQEQTAGEVPVQPEAGGGEADTQGQSQAKPEATSKEVKIDKPTIATNATAELERVKASEGEDGATFNIDGTKYEGGGLVVPVASMNTTAEEITPEMIADFVEQNQGKIGDSAVKVGIYKFPNSNEMSIDLNIVAPETSREQAIEFGKMADQESLFDLSTFENVKTGGTGANPAQFTDEQFREISKALNEGRVPNVFGQQSEALYTAETASNFDSVANEIDIEEGGDRAAGIVRAADLVSRAFPGVKIHLHRTQESFDGVMQSLGSEEYSKTAGGIFANGEIHINLSNRKADSKTVYHEAFHYAISQNGGDLRKMVNDLKKALAGKHDDLVRKIEEFEAMYTDEAGNTDMDRAEEFLSELFGVLADNEAQLDTNTLQKIANAINVISQKLFGRPVFSEAASRQEIVDFMNSMSRSVVRGEKVQPKELKRHKKKPEPDTIKEIYVYETDEDGDFILKEKIKKQLTEQDSKNISKEVVSRTKKGKNYSTFKIFRTKGGDEYLAFDGEINQSNVKDNMPDQYITVASKLNLYNTAITDSVDLSSVDKTTKKNHDLRLSENKVKIEKKINSAKRNIAKIKQKKYKEPSEKKEKLEEAMNELLSLQEVKKSKSLSEMNDSILSLSNRVLKSSLHKDLILNIGSDFSRLNKKDMLQKSEEIYNKTKEVIKNNLKTVYNSVSPRIRDISKLWYDGANVIAQEWANEYGLSLEQVSAIIATQSPQMPWFDNLHLAHVIMDTMSKSDSMVFTESMYNDYIEKAKKYDSQKKYAPSVKKLIGKKLSEMNDYDAAIFIRLDYDANISRKAPIRIPTGTNVGSEQTGDSSFSGYDVIAKGVSVFRDGSDTNIDNKIGRANKVRNFYLNIADPSNERAVTIDTHAMAIALMKPLASNDFEVDFGPASFAFYADAYRELASELGIKARELQSITWEAARAIFPAKNKAKDGYKDEISSIWDRYIDGSLSIEDVYGEIFNQSENPNITEWSDHIKELKDERKRADVSGRIVRKQESTATDRLGDVSGVDSGVSGSRGRSSDVDKKSGVKVKKQLTEEELTPLPGAPKYAGAAGPDPNLVAVAKKYAADNGIPFNRQGEYVEVDEEFSKRIADAYEKMVHDPANPKVREAYENLINQTKAQYDALIEDGYEFTFFDDETDPYDGNPVNAMRDLRSNKKMAVYGTYAGYGTEGITDSDLEQNPLLSDTGLKWKDQNGVEQKVTANDLFRAVHDAFGHGLEGAGFRARGEENAWQAHVRLFTGSAVAAITSETRGQNSWLNYGPYGEKNRTAKVEDTVFAEQKIGLMPEWTWTENKAPDYKSKVKKQLSSKAAVNDAFDKYKISRGRGNTISQAKSAAINDLKKNDWYVNADDTQREEAVRELRAMLGEKEKKAPQASKVAGQQKPKNKVTVNEYDALVDQIRLEARAARGKKAQLKKVSEMISDEISKMITKGIMDSKVSAHLVKKLANLNLDNPAHVDAFLDRFQKVMNDAEYIGKLSKANKMRKFIKSRVKGGNNPMATFAKTFGTIEPSNVENIDEYIENAQKIVDSMKVSRVSKGDVVWKTEVPIKDMIDYTKKQIEEQNQMKIDALAARYESITGESASGKSYDDMALALAELSDSKENSDNVREAIKGKQAELRSIVQDLEEAGAEVPTSVREAMFADTEIMSVRDAIEMMDAIDSYIANGLPGGLAQKVARYKGKKEAINFNNKSRKMRTFGSRYVGRLNTEFFTNINMMTERMFGSQSIAQKFRNVSGLAGVINGNSKAERMASDIQNEYVKKFRKVKGFDKNENVYERGVISFLMRNVDSSVEDQIENFNKRVGLLYQSVEMLKKGGDIDKAKAELYQKVLDKLDVANAQSIDDVIAAADPVNVEAVKFIVGKWSTFYDQFRDFSLSVRNTMLASDYNYTPDKYSFITAKEDAIDADLSNAHAVSRFNNIILNKNEAGVFMETKRPAKLPKNSFVDLNFDFNNMRSMKLALTDMYTAESIYQLTEFTNSEEFDEMVPDAEDRELFSRVVRGYVNSIKGKGLIDNSSIKPFIRFMNSVGSFGAARALAGASQAVSQFSTAMTNTVFNAGPQNISLSSLMSKKKQDFINRSGMGIANRGIDSMSGLPNIDDMSVNFSPNLASRVFTGTTDTVTKLNTALLKYTLANPDVAAARIGWLAYYEKYCKKNGIEINYDADPNPDAAQYAQSMIDRNMDVSDAAMKGKLFTSTDGWHVIMKNIFFPFVSFSMNMKQRMWIDANAMFSKETSAEDRKAAASSLSSIVAEMGVYTMIRYYVASAIAEAAMAIVGVDDEEKEEIRTKLKENIKDGIFSKAVEDLVSPSPIMSNNVLSAFNKMFELSGVGVDEKMIDEAVKQKNIERAEEGKLPMDKVEEEMFREKLYTKDLFQFYINDEKSGGMYSIQLDRTIETYNMIKAATTGEYEAEYDGRKFDKVLTEEGRKKMMYPAIMKLAGNLSIRELNAVADKSFKTIKDIHGMTKKQAIAYDKLKEYGKPTPFEMELIKKGTSVETVAEFMMSTTGMSQKYKAALYEAMKQ